MAEGMNIDFEQLEKLLTVGQVAEMMDVEPRIVRREARKDKIPGCTKILGKYGFDPELVEDWEPPEPGTRRGRSTREDGRKRYKIYLSDDELAALKEQGFEIVNPRIAARERRARRKAKAETASPSTGEAEAPAAEPSDPFADFSA